MASGMGYRSLDFAVCLDASAMIGYRAFIDNERFNGRWSPLQLPLSIAYKGLFPVILAAHVWGPHRHILFHVDNETVVHILNRPLVLRGHMTNASFKQ